MSISALIFIEFKGITGFTVLNLDNVSSQSANNSIILDFYKPGTQIINLDLENYNF